MKIVGSLILLAAISGVPVQAQESPTSTPSGQVFRVDDSGTVVVDPVLEMQWQPPGRTGTTSLVSASTRVSVQLNLASWVGRSGRIYMTLPRTAGPTVRATWTTGGTLLSGTLISGDRALVYAGPVSSPLLRDLIDIELEADGARLAQPEALAFGFEIEIDQ
jgi:hypothetical protein